jgi:hypothetical protein
MSKRSPLEALAAEGSAAGTAVFGMPKPCEGSSACMATLRMDRPAQRVCRTRTTCSLRRTTTAPPGAGAAGWRARHASVLRCCHNIGHVELRRGAGRALARYGPVVHRLVHRFCEQPGQPPGWAARLPPTGKPRLSPPVREGARAARRPKREPVRECGRNRPPMARPVAARSAGACKASVIATPACNKRALGATGRVHTATARVRRLRHAEGIDRP